MLPSIPQGIQGSSSLCSAGAITPGSAGRSVGRSPRHSTVVPCPMPAAGWCPFPIFRTGRGAASLQPSRPALRAEPCACAGSLPSSPEVPAPTSARANQDIWAESCRIKGSLGWEKQSCGERRPDRRELRGRGCSRALGGGEPGQDLQHLKLDWISGAPLHAGAESCCDLGQICLCASGFPASDQRARLGEPGRVSLPRLARRCGERRGSGLGVPQGGPKPPAAFRTAARGEFV